MKKAMVLLAVSALGSTFLYQNVSHADTVQGVKTTQNQKILSSKMDSISFPWGNTGLKVIYDDGTLHIPSGIVTNPPGLSTVFSETSHPWATDVRKIVLDGPLFVNGSAANLFSGFPNVLEFSGLNNLDTANVTDMSNMFADMSSITSLDVSHFNTQNVTNMDQMFWAVKSVTSLNLDNFNTQNVTDMGAMFIDMAELKELNISHFNTSKVTDMSWMFLLCSKLQSINLSSFNTSNVTKMSSMFSNCKSLTSLELSNFNTNKLTDMRAMFQNCSSLVAVDLSSFILPETTLIQGMLEGTPSLSILKLAPNSRIRTATALYQDTAGNTIASNRVFGGQENVDTFNFLPKVIPGYTFQTAKGKSAGALAVAPQTVTFIYTKNK